MFNINGGNGGNGSTGAVNLTKGGRISLTKGTKLKRARVGLGWSTPEYNNQPSMDLDASVFLVNPEGKVRPNENFVFYGNDESFDKSVKHSGDNRTGGTADSIEEEITIDFEKIAPNVDKIAIVVTIHDAEALRQNFGQVSNAFIVIHDEETGKKLADYKLDEDFSTETSVTFVEILRKNNEWDLKAVGAGFNGGLRAMCKHYGLDVEN